MSSEAQRISQRYSLNTTQAAAVEHCLERDHTLLVADKGAGKTRTGLAIADESEGRTLIVCPNKVRHGWVQEGRTLDVPVTLVEGSEAARTMLLANPDCKIVVLGVDLLPWFVDTYRGRLPVAGLIIDETTRFGTPGNLGVKKLRQIHKDLDWVLGLTAHPVMEKPLHLYGQALVVDGGRSLGRSYDRFKQAYFYPEDYQQRSWALKPMAGEALAGAVAGLVYVMEDKAYADSLVPLTEEVVPVEDLPRAFWQAYESLCEEMAMAVDGGEIEAANEAVVSGKLEQLCQGAVYDRDAVPHWVHFAKFDLLRKLVGSGGEPTIITYSFIYELEKLREMFPDGKDLKDSGALSDFNEGRIDLLFMHPRSGSHGINAQVRCCEMICLKPVWSADAWDQVIGRIRRRGQTRPCRRRTLVIPGTVDELILDRVAGKEETGDSLLAHIKAAARK